MFRRVRHYHAAIYKEQAAWWQHCSLYIYAGAGIIYTISPWYRLTRHRMKKASFMRADWAMATMVVDKEWQTIAIETSISIRRMLPLLYIPAVDTIAADSISFTRFKAPLAAAAGQLSFTHRDLFYIYMSHQEQNSYIAPYHHNNIIAHT